VVLPLISSLTQALWICSLDGQIRLVQKGHLGNYPYPVWYNPNGIANILSLFNVSKAYCVTMDTSNSLTMRVHLNNESFLDFTPTAHGLWVYHVSNPQNVQDIWSMVSTVDEKKKLYTKRAYKRALLARKLQNIIMRPSTRSYQDTIIDHIADCPIMTADIQAAETIFGPNLKSLKGRQFVDQMTMSSQEWIPYPAKS
jgi:hypothetical protein